MPTVVIPFAGAEGKTRLHPTAGVRRTLALAMFGDVLAACVCVGPTRVVTVDDEAAHLASSEGAAVIADPGGGQGAAVEAGLAEIRHGGILVVNADVPCVVPDDLRALVAAMLPGSIAFVEAEDGTTNALSLPGPEVFAPVYGSRSANRFRGHAASLGLDAVSVALYNLANDVDTPDDLQRLQLRVGPRTQAALVQLEGALA